MRKSIKHALFVLMLTSATSGCSWMNPYVRSSAGILKYYGATYCWVHAGLKEKSACQNDAAIPALKGCVEELRPMITWRTTEEIATQKICSCMGEKGWDRLWIDGAILFG